MAVPDDETVKERFRLNESIQPIVQTWKNENQRLRARVADYEEEVNHQANLLAQAAQERNVAEAEVERLRAALKEISDLLPCDAVCPEPTICGECGMHRGGACCGCIARLALAETK